MSGSERITLQRGAGIAAALRAGRGRAGSAKVGHMARPLPDYRFLDALAALPFVQAVWLFGSRARGTARERSDIDLAILCPAATPADWQRLRDLIEEADTLLVVDAVRFDELAPDDPLRDAILRDRVVLSERAPA